MKRTLSGFCTAVLLLLSLLLSAYAQTTIDVTWTQNAGRLDVVVQFDYRESAAALAGRELSLTLLGDSGALCTVPISGGDETRSIPETDASVRTTLYNPQNAPLSGNEKVGFCTAEFTGLPRDVQYRVRLEGRGYQSLTSGPLSLDEYAPRVYISAKSGGFALGDVTGDQVIDGQDLSRVSGALGKSPADADVNQDGKTDITDLALVHHNMGERRAEEVYAGALTVSGILDAGAIADEMAGAGLSLEGKLEDLFEDNGRSVRLTAPAGGTLEIPITLAEPKEMSEIRIVSPAVDGALEKGSVQVEYEGGFSENIDYDLTPPEETHATEREAGVRTVVIPLEGRVPVKKITITVEKVLGEDGKARYTIIEKIEFLQDIVPDNIDLGASIPKNVTAAPGSRQVSLSWRAVDNVDGYIVRYGTSAAALTRQLRVGTNSAVITGLKNLTAYYFTVSAYSGSWNGDASAAVSCVPQPDRAPLPPDNLSLSPEDSAIAVGWKKTEDAEFYNLYYKKSSDKEFQIVKEEYPSVSCVVEDLENGVSYDFYVTAGNQKGTSGPSLTASGTPVKEEIDPPVLPTRNRIPNSAIVSAQMENPKNVSDPGFDVRQVYDEDFETSWTARVWWESSRFTFEFDEEQDMDYLIYVPRLNRGYPESIARYSVAAWDEDGNMTWLTPDEGKLTNRADTSLAPTLRGNPKETGYAILPFEHNEHIKKISVLVRQWDGARKPSSLSEIAFYTYDDIETSVAALFSDRSYTSLVPGVKQEQIDELRARIENTDGYLVHQDVLLDELDLAAALCQGDKTKLGAVVDHVQSRDASADPRRINTFQPIGVTAEAGKQVVFYAQIPEGEKVYIVPTQHFAEAARWSGQAIELRNGRNILTMPRINDVSPQKGGSLYLQYAGSRADEIRIQVRGGTKIPLLELSDWHDLSENEVRARMDAYLAELERYCGETLRGLGSSALQTSILNATEIAFPHVLLSLPATEVRRGLDGGADALYNDGLAWEELMRLMYYTHGIDEAALEGSASRHNIRYMRMFGGAFMYAAGNHIGIGYGSASGMMGGRPTSVTGKGNANGLFGWGIQHEIGHVMDSLGKAEITNNIYSLFAQTRDGGENALPSRLEKSNKYESIFAKVTSGQRGMANDVFVSLGMYWQLHLAYDGADGNFYHDLNRLPGSKANDNAFMAAASEVAGKDLSEFFSAWGLTPSGQSGGREERRIQYLTDESRRERMAGTQKQSGSVGITASYSAERRMATVSIAPVSGAKMLGYEIVRELNGETEVVGFLSARSGETVWTDSLGSVNNKAVTYSVNAIDILGYPIASASAGQLEISHDNLIPRDRYTWSSDDGLIASFSGAPSVAGIRFGGESAEGATLPSVTLGLSGGNILVEADAGSGFTPVLEIPADEVEADRLYFFTRKDADGSICPCDAVSVRISGVSAEAAEQIDFAAYPGDNIQFGEIGRLGESYGDIPAGTLIVTGSFRGNPVFNTIHVYGRSQSGDMASGELTETDRVPLEGRIYLFAALPKTGDMAEIDNGLWIFVPSQQSDTLSGGEDGACTGSLLPTQVMAELIRTNVPEGGAGRVTGDTRWISSPTYESMPTIRLED